MDSYYSDLTTEALNKAVVNLTHASQYASDADAPGWILNSIDRLRSGVQNRIKDVLCEREPNKKA